MCRFTLTCRVAALTLTRCLFLPGCHRKRLIVSPPCWTRGLLCARSIVLMSAEDLCLRRFSLSPSARASTAGCPRHTYNSLWG